MFIVKLSCEDLDVNPDHLKIIEEKGILVINALLTNDGECLPQKENRTAEKPEYKIPR